jgi:hypothetical protein
VHDGNLASVLCYVDSRERKERGKLPNDAIHNDLKFNKDGLFFLRDPKMSILIKLNADKLVNDNCLYLFRMSAIFKLSLGL